jgi:hypothetical protein
MHALLGRPLRERHRRLTQVRADGGYVEQLVDFAHRVLGMALTVVKRTDDVWGFIVLPKSGWWSAAWWHSWSSSASPWQPRSTMRSQGQLGRVLALLRLQRV